MKKILLLLSILTISITSVIAATASGNLNPFAYDLKSTFNRETLQMEFWFKLNAPAKRVQLIVTDHNGIDHILADETTLQDQLNFYYLQTLDPNTMMGRDFTWRVDVYGEAHNEALFVSNENKLYYPTSIDIDNNPENANFGTVFCIEGRGYKDANGAVIEGTQYISSYNHNGAGLYLFNADGTRRPLPRKNAGYNFGVDVERYGWNGGVDRNVPGNFIGQNKNLTGFGVFRVRVANDGRIFITSMTPNGEVLYEANKNVFSDTDGTYWEDRNWKRVMSSQHEATYLRGNKTIGSSNGIFYAAPNMGFDVRGAGDDLQLLMLSGTESALTDIVVSGFSCDEYNIGTNVKWEQEPSKHYFTGYAITPDGSQVQYDKNGNVWMSQFRSYQDQYNSYPTLMKFIRNADGSITPVVIDETQVTYRRCGAIRFNKDFTKFAVVSPGQTGVGGTITIYPVGEDGNPIFTQGKNIDVADKVGLSVMDLAWDYADNLYIAADHATGSGEDEGRCIGIYAMPRESNMVSTPAASKYAFSTRYHVKWDNLFVHGQDVEDGVYNYMSDRNELYDYTGLNHRLWKLVQVGFNNYRNSLHSTNKKDEVRDQWPENRTPGTHKIDLRVKDFFINNDKVTEEEVIGFFTNDSKFSWLGDYLSEVSGQTLDTKLKYAESLHNFINRKDKFIEKGKPRYWRSLFVKNVLGLNDRVLFDEGMPINWQWTRQDEVYFVDLWVESWHALKHNAEWLAQNGYQYAALPSEWYYFNTIRNLKSEDKETGGMGYTWLSDYFHILAWRDGGVEGNIVHNVNRDNMELHATYVEKNIDEADVNPSRPLDFDASNDDVMQLMMNKRFGDDGEHTFSITRRLQAGMYNTICLPFDLDLEALPVANEQDRANHPLFNATAMQFAGMEPNNVSGESVTILQFTQVTKLEAGVPYLIQVQKDIANDMEFWQVPKTSMILPAQANSVSQGGVTFHGVINPTKIPKSSVILVANNRLAVSQEEGEMLGMRGYFTIDPNNANLLQQAADGRIMLDFKKPVSTSVIVAPESEQSATPVVRKIMQNNHLYILRGGKVYTITGNRVQ